MNPRIQELVGQAKFAAEETLNKQISKNAELDAFAEKFAELIVQECADVCERFGESGDGYTCSAEILEHFGVKE